MPDQTHCPLCGHGIVRTFHEDLQRSYLRCARCQLVFVPEHQHLSLSEERAEYDKHENSAEDAGYRRFLSRLAKPLAARLAVPSRGLDFGSGPGPALAALLREQGHEVLLYDPFYAPDEQVFTRTYDFICATEVVEHLRAPGRELDRLWSLLRPGGWLGIMTKLVRDQAAFASWHYRRDPTHVCFFCVDTWNWWAQSRQAELEFHGADVILLRRPLH